MAQEEGKLLSETVDMGRRTSLNPERTLIPRGHGGPLLAQV